jgi:WD40 repeat protein
MEFVDGPSLQEVIDSKGALNVAVACEYIRQAALGLHAAHEAGMVHRDIKPANLLVDSTGTIKVLDLGLARFTPKGQESVTAKFDEGPVMGTADYLAPEQAVSLHNADHRSDIYSLGATFYALLAGEPPFANGTVAQKLLWHQMREPAPLAQRNRNVPNVIAQIIKMMMDKIPEYRFASALAVAEALQPFCEPGKPPQGKSRSPEMGKASLAGSQARIKPLPASSQQTERVVQQEAATLDEPKAAQPMSRRPASGVKNSAVPVAARKSGTPWAVLLLVSVMLAFFTLIGGILVFLFLGPGPNAGSTSMSGPQDRDDQPNPRFVTTPTLQPIGKELFALNGHIDTVHHVAYSPDGKKLVSGGADRTVRVWDLAKRTNELTIEKHTGIVNWVSVHASGNQILSASADKTARLWEYPSGKELRKFDDTDRLNVGLFGLRDEVITAGSSGEIKIWDAKTGSLLRACKGHTKVVPTLALWVLPQQRGRLLSASGDNSFRIWDIDKGESLRTMSAQDLLVLSLATDAAGKTAITGGIGDTLVLWDLETGTKQATFLGHAGAIFAVAMTADGRWAISGGLDKKAILWDLKSRKLVRRYEGHTKAIRGLAISPDGSQFASCGFDESIRVWSMTER